MTLVDSDDGQREPEARHHHSVGKAKPWLAAQSCEENFALNVPRLCMYGTERVCCCEAVRPAGSDIEAFTEEPARYL